jgi:hypothetical protein
MEEKAAPALVQQENKMQAGAENTATTESVLVGKSVAEIKQLGYYNCVGIGLDEVPNGAMQYSVKWAPNNTSCFAGRNFITIERLLTGDGSFTEDRLVEAELVVYPEENGRSYTTVPLSVNGGPNQFYVVEYTGKSYQTITGVQKLWLMNLDTKKFEETPVPPAFSFVNPYQIEAE